MNYIDGDGLYELPASVIKNYPLFSSYLKNNVKSDVMRSKIILNAFAKNTAADNPNGIGNLTREEVEKAVTWGKGPMIIIRDNPGGMEGANGYYNFSTGQIELSSKRITDLEIVLASDASDEIKLKSLLAVYMTLLHETVHYGDYLDKVRQDGGEPGVDFEIDVWQGKEINIGDEVLFVQYFSGDKYNPIDIQEIIDEKRKTEEGMKTLPTLPK